MSDKETTVWASRDVGSNSIKIWVEEPKFVEPNNTWVGKTYLGISCANLWPGPSIDEGESVEVVPSFKKLQKDVDD